MSGYRTYVPWNKNSTAGNAASNYSSNKKETNSSTTPKYESPYTKSRNDAKKSEDKSSTSSSGSKYSSAYSAGYQRDTTSSRNSETSSSTKNELPSRIKSPTEKKESHPPVTYRPLTRTTAGTRSRDPSPVDRDKTESSSSSSYNFNRLCPRTYSRSVSREKLDTIGTTIPKYSGRSSLNTEDYNKYQLGRASRNASREDLSLAKYKPPDTKELLLAARLKSKEKEDLANKYKSKEDLSNKYKTKDDLSNKYKTKEDLSNKYKTKEDLSNKYKTKEDLLSSRFKASKEDISTSRLKASKEDISTSKYSTKADTSSNYKSNIAPSSRTTSREDLTKAQPKYITSRFLPKNSIEKSNTAYIRPSSRTSDVSRKNREILNVLSRHNDDKSRSISRTSSSISEEAPRITKTREVIEYETITIVTRSTSPNPPNSQPSYLRPKRIDIAKLIEKQITRPKKRGKMIDKEMQSDRLDDTTKQSRFAGASRIAAAPWSSYLDLKYSSPKESKSSDLSDVQPKDSPKSLSRSSSEKSTNLPKSENKQKEKTKSKISPPKTSSENKKLLPPTIPKSETSSKPTAFIPLSTPNKDFRKSVLNMNPEGVKSKKSFKRSSSASSESSTNNSESNDNTDTSKKSQSKLPQLLSSKGKDRSRSPSSSSESSSSSNEDDIKPNIIKSNIPSKLKIPQSISSSRTSILLSSADELSLDKSPRIPLSPKIKSEKEAESRSFLMRALAPVTNLFKAKPEVPNHSKVIVECDNSESTDKNISDLPFSSESDQKQRRFIRKIQSGDRAWWVEEDSPKNSKMTLLRHVDSGERAWWLDDKVEVPKGVEVFPATSTSEDGVVEDGRLVYKNRKNISDNVEWWLDSEGTDKSIPDLPESSQVRLIHKIESGERAWWLEEETSHSSPKGKIKLIRHVESGERAWWLDDSVKVPESVETHPATSTTKNGSTESGRLIYTSRKNNSDNSMWWLSSDNTDVSLNEPEFLKNHKIRHIDSGERAWWLSSVENLDECVNDDKKKPCWDHENNSDDDFDNEIPLGDRASPEGLETPREGDENRLSPYDNVPRIKKANPALFISKHTNIDEILGGSSQLLSPLMNCIFSYQDLSDKECEEISAEQVKIHQGTPPRGEGKPDSILENTRYESKLDDAALQLYKDGDYGSYLDLDASISEQQEEFDGFQTNKKNSIVLRTQLSVRVHTIIEKLLTSEGRELRRALFSLKQIFQEDKDLVHEFVQNDGLACLIKVGSEADQNYQNYILRALGQVMLYVDGMNGVMEHNQTVQWLYTLISSKFRLVVKTALKLLLVFVEYTDSNCMLLIKAIHAVDFGQGLLPWHNIMKLLKDFDSADTELLIYATTLINKCLNGVPDQDTYYDQTDALEEQGIETIIQKYMSKPGTDLDLLQQFQIYEAVLQYEDGENKGTPIRHLDESIRKTLRSRKSLVDSTERRKSRRHSTGNTPIHNNLNNNNHNNNNNNIIKTNLINKNEDDDESSSSQSSNGHNHQNLNGSYKDCNKTNDAGVTPALRRRRERAERQRSFMKEQQENATLLRGAANNNCDENNENGNYTNGLQQRLLNGNNVLNRNSCKKDLTPFLNAVNKLDSEENGLTKQSWIMYNDEKNQDSVEENENSNENDRKMLLQLKKENTVKDLTQKLSSQNILHSPPIDDNKVNRMEGMTGLINKAKEGLAKSKSQVNVLKSPTGENIPKVVEVKKSENELRWEELVSSMSRPLNLCDMDFTDLTTEDEVDILAPVAVSNGIPPPPPPIDLSPAPPPPPRVCIPPPVPNPPIFGGNLQKLNKTQETKIPIKKNKKTVKLFWKEVREDNISNNKLKTGYIWDELSPVSVDTQKLEHLFESRAKDLINKKQQELNKNKEIIVLDPKRSNAINIGMTKLPPPRSIKTAILKMDATIMNREGIEKLLTMLPTEEERTKIQEAQAANPDLPLGSAEQFLLTLASISELTARLKLWAFKLDFENTEREIAEPLMDLKQGFEVLKVNKTFRCILSTLLSIGNFLNGNEVKGFQIEYLSKVPEVKDTVHKHSLLHHLCHTVMEKFPDATDLYSEIGAITRASKVDFDELTLNIQRLESDCKASWDHLKLIAKHDGSTMKSKMSDFLADCAERIILLGMIHRRVMNRFHKFLLWLGIPLHQVGDTRPNEFCRIVSEFALEYRTTRERVLQQLEKKANHRERNKTRGKMITETGKFRTKEDRADAELRQLLGSDISDVESLQGTLPWRRTRKDTNRSLMGTLNGHLTDGDDEILESLVKTATKAPTSRTAPRERKRTRHADRKSLKRSRTRENPFGHRDSP